MRPVRQPGSETPISDGQRVEVYANALRECHAALTEVCSLICEFSALLIEEGMGSPALVALAHRVRGMADATMVEFGCRPKDRDEIKV